MQSAYDAFQEGNRLLESQNPHAAVIVLERARDLEPDKASVRETLARAYYRSGRFTQAGAEFERAVEIEPVNDYAHFGLGLCLLRTLKIRPLSLLVVVLTVATRARAEKAPAWQPN